MNREEKLNVIEMKLKKFMDSHIIVADLIEQVLTGCKKYGFIAIEKEQIKEEIQDEIQQNQEKEKINVYQEKIFLNDEKLNPHQNYPIQIVEGSQQPEREQNYAQQQELQMREQQNKNRMVAKKTKDIRNQETKNQITNIKKFVFTVIRNLRILLLMFNTYIQDMILNQPLKIWNRFSRKI